MSNTYFCKSNLKHNGKFLKKGDAVDLNETDAKRLMKAKVVQSQPIPEEDIEPDFVPEAEDETPATPEGGGTAPVESGEQSIDGGENKQNSGSILSRFRKSPDAPTEPKKDPSEGM